MEWRDETERNLKRHIRADIQKGAYESARNLLYNLESDAEGALSYAMTAPCEGQPTNPRRYFRTTKMMKRIAQRDFEYLKRHSRAPGD